jgi:hypothetical protein
MRQLAANASRRHRRGLHGHQHRRQGHSRAPSIPSLARLWCDQGKVRQARELLALV